MAFSFQSVPKGIRTLIIITVAVWIAQIVPWLGSTLMQWGEIVPE